MKRAAPIKRRTPIRRVSKKKRTQDNLYRPRCSAIKQERAICETGCGANAQNAILDVHHKEGRGPNYLREETWMVVCRKCHRWIHDNPGQARAKGWLK